MYWVCIFESLLLGICIQSLALIPFVNSKAITKEERSALLHPLALFKK